MVDATTTPDSVVAPHHWGIFGAVILVMLVLDLGVFNRRAHRPRARESFAWVVVWFLLAAAFNGYLYFTFGGKRGAEFTTGYLLELSLSVDNLFVFLMIFNYFRVPGPYQHRVLFWGILLAILLRIVFIAAGIALVDRYHEILYVFGVILIWTGWKIMAKGDDEVDPEKNVFRRLFKKFVPMTPDYEGQRFIIRRDGRRLATPLLMVMSVIAPTDMMFALDSIPAILGVTTDRFVVITSNVFAVMGLRAFYFLIAEMMDRFRYLKLGLGLVLIFIGVKMLLPIFEVKLPTEVSLGVVVGLLGGCIVTSLVRPVRQKKA